MTNRDVRVVVAWAARAVVPSLVLGSLLLLAVHLTCRGSTGDCSWGLELLLVIPVLLFGWFVWGPLAVRRLAGARAMVRCELFGVAGLFAVYAAAANGWLPFLVTLGVVSVAVPLLAVRRAGYEEAVPPST